MPPGFLERFADQFEEEESFPGIIGELSEVLKDSGSVVIHMLHSEPIHKQIIHEPGWKSSDICSLSLRVTETLLIGKI